MKFLQICGEYINFDDVRSYTFTAQQIKLLFKDGTSRVVQVDNIYELAAKLEFDLSEMIPAQPGFWTVRNNTIQPAIENVERNPIIAWRRTAENTVVPVTVLGRCEEEYDAIIGIDGRVYHCNNIPADNLGEWFKQEKALAAHYSHGGAGK